MKSTVNYLAERSQEYMNAPKLSAVEERELLMRWRGQSDHSARRRLIECSMRHVVAIARRYRRYPVAFGDLIAEGSLGLVIAIDRFDVSKNVRLVTYASYWIRAYVFQAIIKEWKRGKTGLGMTRSKTFFKIRRLLATQIALHGERGPNLKEMAQDLDVSVKSLRDMLDYLETYDVSLDGDWSGEGEKPGRLHDRMADGRPCPESVTAGAEYRSVMHAVIERALRCLDERERLVASARLMEDEPRTLAELGRTMGVSRERARQIEVRARQKLNRALKREGLTSASLMSFGA
ncbi:MAG: sigma-70 family RNA polymerase sigma factor [Deltaproteobacteria bacterium]|nr:sigma-70 family RNA polymerase sigma factor [Deltaproteobacteria bacterium]